jgi:hypothetical protein
MDSESDAAAIAATATLRSEVTCFGIAFSFGDALAIKPWRQRLVSQQADSRAAVPATQ